MVNGGVQLNNRVSCSIFKKHLFYEEFNIIDKSDEFKEALGTIAYNEKSTMGRYAKVHNTIELYSSMGIYEIFGINLFEFMKLSNEELSMLMDIAASVNEKKAETIDELKSKIGGGGGI